MAKTQKALRPPNAGEDVEQQEFSFTAGGIVKWHGHFARQFAVSYKVKHSLTIRSSSSAPCYLPK